MRIFSVCSNLLRFITLTFCSGIISCHTISSETAANPLTAPLAQQDLQPTEITGFDDQRRQLKFQIRGAELDPKDLQQELYLYTVFYQDMNQTWQNLCHGDAHYEAKAIALQGSWDSTGSYHAGENLVTFSCTNGALAKCVRFGYKPWQTMDGQLLQDYHQACVRMVRADYCGNGVGHTKDGTPINIYDRLEIQKPDAAPEMQFEAAWGVDGAQSIHHTRYPKDLAYVQRVCPERLVAEVNRGNPATDQQSQRYHSEALLFNDSLVRTP